MGSVVDKLGDEFTATNIPNPPPGAPLIQTVSRLPLHASPTTMTMAAAPARSAGAAAEKRMVDPPRVVGEYKLLEEIGVGSFAKVYLATHLRTGDVVAVKEIDPRRIDERVRGGILEEKAILSTLSHPNILRLIDTIQVVTPKPSNPGTQPPSQSQLNSERVVRLTM